MVSLVSLIHSGPRLPAVQTRYFYDTVAHLYPLLYSTARVGLHHSPLNSPRHYRNAQQRYSVLYARAQGEISILNCFRSNFPSRPKSNKHRFRLVSQYYHTRRQYHNNSTAGFNGWAILGPFFFPGGGTVSWHIRRLRAPHREGSAPTRLPTRATG